MTTRLERLKNKIVLVTGINLLLDFSVLFVCSRVNRSLYNWMVLKFDDEGGGGAIGREICIHCAEEGAFVFLCDLDKVKGNFLFILNPE
jgi:hypothetical protein